ncbi:hypothetical protein BpHYR1_013216 [Brachionus plicatilis]|uniref:Uncharacterized protein n=1 Tax=Brachionus plicatilis TaxID=10195 RepID=A0A3M7QLC3_BRAPC|nr:hypothetical protein BpHYR1_013216 [Brachionus plicatilis]
MQYDLVRILILKKKKELCLNNNENYHCILPQQIGPYELHVEICSKHRPELYDQSKLEQKTYI